ncbi:cytochrome P450 [Trametes meyenii]|nr:cytochrome P450 [Trametes meyenii]
MPQTKQWIGFQRLCAQYGEIVYLNILGDPMVVLGSPRVIEELLEKRSANTSDRPDSPILPLIGNDIAFSIMRYGQWWRDHRRAFWQIFHPGAIGDYREIQRTVLHKFLKNLADAPQNYKEHIRYAVAATVLKVLYGFDAKEKGDPIIKKVSEALSCASELATGTHPVDFFPFLRHVPGWFPGCGFQYVMAKCKASVTLMKEAPFAQMEAAIDRGQAAPRGLAILLSKIDDDAGSEEAAYRKDVLKNVGLIAFEAGSDTSYSTLMAFFLAMSQYPDVQKKAQAELDRVVGRSRLPDFDDREALVYIDAIIKESLRWHVVLPLCLPHRTLDNDVFDGYFIPAGTLLVPNTAVMHDPQIYDNPYEFRPERFIRDGKLDPAVLDPYAYVFGYGRRICPGRYFADEALYLDVASVLHIFNIEPPLDAQGMPVKIELEQTHGLLSYPENCRCTVKPRWKEAVILIE